MKTPISTLLFVLSAFAIHAPAALAFPADGCEQQRAQFPANWSDTTQEKAFYDCRSHYDGKYTIKLGQADDLGRALMSITHGETVYRIWLDREQAARLQEGKYFATVVREEKSCWIRGDLDGAPTFFMDNASPASDSPDSGSFYNKAPRFGTFNGGAINCEPAGSEQ